MARRIPTTASWCTGCSEPERWRVNLARHLRVPYWTVDADLIVPAHLLEKEQYAARTIRPRLHRQLGWFLVRPDQPRPKVPWKRPARLHTLEADTRLVNLVTVDRRVGPVGGKHDRPWAPERPVFGLVRYMSLASTSRKFDSRRYIEQVTRDSEVA